MTLVRSLPIERRRHLFLLLLGDGVETGNGSQAFALEADLVVANQDIADSGRFIAKAVMERRRLYSTFLAVDVRRQEVA